MQPSPEAAAVIPLRLPPASRGAEHFDWEHIAYLLPGAVPTVVDPGPPERAAQLRAALEGAGCAPVDVQQVLLTSRARELAGAAGHFPDARIFAAATNGHDRLLALHRDRTVAMGEEVIQATSPSKAAQAAWHIWCDDHAAVIVPLLNVRPLSDGAVILAGDITLVASHRPAFSDAGLVFTALDSSVLFAGEFGVLEEDLPVGDWQAFADSLGAITQASLPDRLYPSRGRIEATGQVAFRAMALSANNLISNLPLALARPATLQQLFERDLGYWPDAIAESALRLVRLRAALEELARAGVVYRQPGETLLSTTYAMVPA